MTKLARSAFVKMMKKDLEQCTHNACMQAGLAVLCCIEVLEVSSSTQHMHCPMQICHSGAPRCCQENGIYSASISTQKKQRLI